MSTMTMLDPTSEHSPAERQLLPRLKPLSETTVGLLDISKPRGKEFLDEVQTELEALGATAHPRQVLLSSRFRFGMDCLCKRVRLCQKSVPCLDSAGGFLRRWLSEDCFAFSASSETDCRTCLRHSDHRD